MTKRQATISVLITVGAAMLLTFAGMQGSQTFNGIAIVLLANGMVFGINWLAFIPAYLMQTEKFYDLMGSVSFLSVSALTLYLTGKTDFRSMLLASLVAVWTVRLGSFLFRRIQKDGKDGRFDTIKPVFVRFLNAWSLQALWVVITAAPVIFAISSVGEEPIGMIGTIGLFVWLSGFLIEVVADYQKTQFRKNPANKDRFINTGLWARSRHPNYFGEIVLWLGITIIAAPVLAGWQWAAVISPIFVMLLLTRVSGVTMLEERADEKWGGQEDYEAYKKNTPVLIPKV